MSTKQVNIGTRAKIRHAVVRSGNGSVGKIKSGQKKDYKHEVKITDLMDIAGEAIVYAEIAEQDKIICFDTDGIFDYGETINFHDGEAVDNSHVVKIESASQGQRGWQKIAIIVSVQYPCGNYKGKSTLGLKVR